MGMSIAHMTTNMAQTELVCEYCGSEFTIFRRKSRLKKAGHVKHMYCHICREDTPHIERGIA